MSVSRYVKTAEIKAAVTGHELTRNCELVAMRELKNFKDGKSAKSSSLRSKDYVARKIEASR
jgi:hypothetical protein